MTEHSKVGQPFPCPAEARRRRTADPNANRPGYKKSKVGWIPEEWAVYSAGKKCDIQLGKMLSGKAKQGDDPQPYLANYNVKWGEFALDKVQTMDFTEREMKKFALAPGDLLVCEGGEVGRCAVWAGQLNPCFYQKALHRVRPIAKDTNIRFLMYVLHHAVHEPRMVHFIGESSIAHFTREKFLDFPIPLPPLPEQQKIAAILSTWDAAIEQTRDLIAAKKQQQNALMQQLLTGKRRLPGFTGEWEARRVGDVFTERRETNGDLTLLAITGQRGIIPAADIDRKDASNADKSRYKVIRVGDLGYNTMRMWQGVNAISSLEGIVSPAYTIAMPGRCLHSPFLKHYFKYEPVVYQFYRYSQGLVSDTWNLKFHHFAEIVLPFPDLSEQRAIAAILDTADRELKSLEDKLAALKEQKKGLMQKLLTGQVRVKTK